MTPLSAPPMPTILLVDDEESIRRVLRLSLGEDGYHVITAPEGREALRLFRERNPDIVLTDIKMPGISGIDLLETIKSERPDTEVIMMTGHGDMQAAMESLKKDATDFITKPIHDDILQIALKRARERIAMRRRMLEYTRALEHQVEEKMTCLEASRRRYQQLFDLSPCYITVQDPSLDIIDANRRFRDDFDGRTGMRCYAAYKQRTLPCPECPVMATFSDGLAHQSEMQVSAKDGTPRHLYIGTAPIHDDDGSVRRVIEMSTDITELRYLRDRLASLGLHAGSVSHTIKGLLTHMDAGIYLLNSGYRRDDRERVTEGLGIVNQSAARIRRMILDVLYYAKERELAFEPMDVLNLAREAAAQFSAKLTASPVILECRFADDVPSMEMDPTAMRIALANLLDNALDACLERSDGPAGRIVFGLQPKNGYIVFEVLDNGIGMTKEAIQNLFDLFFSSKGSRGTGLGLFVAHQIIARHGGTIHVTSAKNRGSHFRVVLPASAKP